MMRCQTCLDLLNDALNLAVRSDQIEQQNRRDAALDASHDPQEWQESGMFDGYVERHNITFPHRKIATNSATMHLWFLDQYDKDLAEWTEKARAHLMTGCT